MRRPYIWLLTSISAMAMVGGVWAGSVVRGIEQGGQPLAQIEAGSHKEAMVLASLEPAASAGTQVPVAMVAVSSELPRTLPVPATGVSTSAAAKSTNTGNSHNSGKTSNSSASVRTAVKAAPKPAVPSKVELAEVEAVPSASGPAGVDGALWSGVRANWKKSVTDCVANEEIFKTGESLMGIPAAVLAGVAVVESRCHTVHGGWMQLLSIGTQTIEKSASALGISRGQLAYQTNPLHAVVTAAAYLSILEAKEGDRVLAMAAYNMGWGNLERITGGVHRSYAWMEPRLPNVTRSWLPGALAAGLRVQEIWNGGTPPAVPGEAEAAALKRLLGE